MMHVAKNTRVRYLLCTARGLESGKDKENVFKVATRPLFSCTTSSRNRDEYREDKKNVFKVATRNLFLVQLSGVTGLVGRA
jgi:hypothetical protein